MANTDIAPIRLLAKQKLKEFYRSGGWSHTKIAEKLGFSIPSVNNWINDPTQIPSLKASLKIDEFLKSQKPTGISSSLFTSDMTVENLVSADKEKFMQALYIRYMNDDISLAEVLGIAESAKRRQTREFQQDIGGMAIRLSVIFGTDKEVLARVKQIRPLAKQDLIKSKVLSGTPFEKKFLTPNDQ